METLLLIIHVIVCVVLIVSILLQAGKGGGLAGGAFGGMGGAGPLGGTSAAPFLTKVTTYVGVMFALTCLGLWYAGRSDDGVPETAAERALQELGPMPFQAAPPLPQALPGVEPTTPTGTGSETAAPAETSTESPAESKSADTGN